MALHGPTELLMSIQTSIGSATHQDFNALVRSGIEVGHQAETAEKTGLGQTFRKHAPTGLHSHEDISLQVLLDDTGSYTLFVEQIDADPTSTGRRLRTIVSDNGHTYHVNVLTVQPRVAGAPDNLQMLNVLTPEQKAQIQSRGPGFGRGFGPGAGAGYDGWGTGRGQGRGMGPRGW